MGFSAWNNVSSTGLMWWLAIAVFVCAIGLIVLGVFDPRPYTLDDETTERLITIQATPSIDWHHEQLPTQFSRRITVQLPTQPEIAAGIALDDGKRPFIVSATNAGFVRIVHGDVVIMPEQAWPLASVDPYVRGGEPAEFSVDVNRNEVTVRINQELLWRGVIDVDVDKNGAAWERWGVFSDGFGQNVNVVVAGWP